MFIAFEGPDNVGKSTSAANLAHDGVALYQATKSMHEFTRATAEESLVYTYDRIDWFSHMVYRLALPDRDWNDDRPRTVFAMPDTHLVVKLHRPDLADFTADEVVDTPIAQVNPMYYWFADYFMALNRQREYALFKTVSIIEVANEGDGKYSQQLRAFDSPVFLQGSMVINKIDSDEALLGLLRYEETQRL